MSRNQALGSRMKSKGQGGPGLIRASLPRLLPDAGLSAHAFFEGAGGEREAEVIADELDAVGTGGVEIAIGAFSFNNQWHGFRAHDLTIALREAGVDQQFDVASHV